MKASQLWQGRATVTVGEIERGRMRDIISRSSDLMDDVYLRIGTSVRLLLLPGPAPIPTPVVVAVAVVGGGGETVDLLRPATTSSPHTTYAMTMEVGVGVGVAARVPGSSRCCCCRYLSSWSRAHTEAHKSYHYRLASLLHWHPPKTPHIRPVRGNLPAQLLHHCRWQCADMPGWRMSGTHPQECVQTIWCHCMQSNIEASTIWENILISKWF